ncbi:MAG: lipid-binding SYLF domain-containing protein [Pirellulales bacterium]
MRFYAVTMLLSLAGLLTPRTAAAWVDPESTVRTADEVLRETMSMSGRRVPVALLADAHAVAIVPGVIKIGFVAAVRRGHGVVMIRDANGAWTLPQFITLTGGSVGWQAGIQGTDVVLVFMTQKSVQGLLNGKFTIGADASAAAGPVGRNAAAATDAHLRAEILSYSRSRGLFAGISLDGTVIEMNPVAQSMYYSAQLGQDRQHVPESAMRLLGNLAQATGTTRVAPPVEVEPAPAAAATTVRGQLATSAKQLYGTVDDGWRKYLALPKEVFEGGSPPRLEALQKALEQYDRVVGSAKYEKLVSREEFQTTYGLLREYVEELSRGARAQLPPPPPVER